MNAIEMKNITMMFGSFKANDNVNLVVEKGEVHALIGENGAGKSTLMSILFGMYHQTAGTVAINGKIVNIKDPIEANALGIGMVHQHFKLVETMSVLDNIILNSEDLVAKTFINTKNSRKKLQAVMDRYGFQLDMDRKISKLSVAEQQRVEILKMLYRDSDILIFDEPTAVLTPQQIKDFLQAIKDLQAKGKTIIIISHKLQELKEVAQRGTVIRKGKYIGTFDMATTTIPQIAEMMVGSSVDMLITNHKPVDAKPIVKVNGLTMNKTSAKNVLGLDNVSLELKPGEILAIAGVEGNGQTELINALSGLQKVDKGTIEIYKDKNKRNGLIQSAERFIATKNKLIEDTKNKTKLSSEKKEEIINKALKDISNKKTQMNKSIELLKSNLEVVTKKNIEKINELDLNRIENEKNRQEGLKKYGTWLQEQNNILSTKIAEINLSTSINNKKQRIEALNIKFEIASANKKAKVMSQFDKVDKLITNKKIACEARIQNTKYKMESKIYDEVINLARVSIKRRYDLGMSHIPEDRHKHGVVLDMNLIDNTIIQDNHVKPFSNYGIINFKLAESHALEIQQKFDVRSSRGLKSSLRSMSGGNQQKFIVGRELSRASSSFVIVAQPTRGLDILAIQNIHKYIIDAKDKGKAVLLISYELDEVLTLADRILVLNAGKPVDTVNNHNITKDQLGVMMTGKKIDNLGATKAINENKSIQESIDPKKEVAKSNKSQKKVLKNVGKKPSTKSKTKTIEKAKVRKAGK